MISPQLYQPIYQLFVTILTIGVTTRYNHFLNNRIKDDPHYANNWGGYLLSILFALYIGFRPFSWVFVDMKNYEELYYTFYFGQPFNFDWGTDNILFDNIFHLFGYYQIDIRVFFVLVALGYFLFSYKAMTVFFKKDALYGFIVWLGAFSTFSYATNGIKAGLAASVFLCALAYYQKPILAIIFLIVSYGIHHSMILPIAAYLICYRFQNTKIYVLFWIIALFISAAHITFFQKFLAGMSDEQGSGYLNDISGNWGGKGGFRIDFIFYGALPVIIGCYLVFKRHIKSRVYQFLLNTYLLTNGIWMLCMYASFTNRIAYLSWAFLPVVTIYPYLNIEIIPNQYSITNYIAWYQLLFTLGMTYIYYA